MVRNAEPGVSGRRVVEAFLKGVYPAALVAIHAPVLRIDGQAITLFTRIGDFRESKPATPPRKGQVGNRAKSYVPTTQRNPK